MLRHDALRFTSNPLTMAYEFKLPDLGEGLTEGEVARWLVPEGAEIAEDDPLVEVQTDKATVEIPSPAAGVVSRILVAEGEVVPVGTVLVVIGGDGACPRQPSGATRRVRDGHARGQTRSGRRAGACARRRSSARSPRSSASTSSRLDGTGPQGRMTEEDVRAAAAPGAVRDGRRGTAGAAARRAARRSRSTWRGRTARCRP